MFYRKPALTYGISPTGNCLEWRAHALGARSQPARSFCHKFYKELPPAHGADTGYDIALDDLIVASLVSIRDTIPLDVSGEHPLEETFNAQSLVVGFMQVGVSLPLLTEKLQPYLEKKSCPSTRKRSGRQRFKRQRWPSPPPPSPTNSRDDWAVVLCVRRVTCLCFPSPLSEPQCLSSLSSFPLLINQAPLSCLSSQSPWLFIRHTPTAQSNCWGARPMRVPPPRRHQSPAAGRSFAPHRTKLYQNEKQALHFQRRITASFSHKAR